MASSGDDVSMEGNDASADNGAAGRFPRHARLILVVAAVLIASTMGGAAAAGLITGRQIKNGTVTGRDVRDHSLRAKDAKSGLVQPGRRGPEGPASLVAGAPGPTGAPGRNGLGGLVTVVSPTPFIVPGSSVANSGVRCPDGFKALGGGASGANQNAVDHMELTSSFPISSLDAWRVDVFNSSGSEIGVYVWVQCAPI